MTESIELLVHNSNDLTAVIGVIPLRYSPTVLDELNREGGCGFKIPAGSAPELDDGTVLEEGSIVRVRVGGRDVSVWEISKISTVLIGEGDKAAEFLSYSGQSLFGWLSHGIVLPEAGAAAVSDDRAFNYAAKQGSWYIASDWKNSVANGTILTARTRWAANGWPAKLAATWLWDRVSFPKAPPGDVYFRREFTTSALTDFRLVGTADDYAVVLIDGVQVMAITQFKSHNRTFSVDVTLPAGNHVMAVKARNMSPANPASNNPAGFVMAMVIPGEKQTEDLVDADRFLWTGDDLTKWKVNGYPVRPPGFTVGGILKVLRDEAVGRGVTTLGQVGLGFTALIDSYGVPWSGTVDPSFKVGDSLLEVVKQISDTYADVWIDYSGVLPILHAAPQRGVDRSVPVGANDPVAFRKAQNVLAASVDSAAEISNTLFMKTSTGIKESAGPVESKSKYGRRETFVSAVTASQDGTAPYLAGQVFDKFAFPRRTPTVDIRATDEQIPFRDFQTGDWVLAPSDTDSSQLVKRRVVSISVTEDPDNGEPEYTIEIDTIQITTEERLARWLQEQGNGSKSGGISGTSSLGQSSGDIPPITGSSGDRPLPIPVDSRRPSPPTALAVSPDFYLDGRGFTIGRISFSFAHDGTATDGTTMAMARYALYYRPSGSGPFQSLTSTTEKSGGYAPLSIQTADGNPARYEIYVEAISEIGTTSFASSTVEVVMSKDTVAPLQPQPPVVVSDRAIFTIKATGKDLNGAPMAVDLATYRVETSPDGTAWTAGPEFLPGMFVIMADLPYGSRQFRLRGVDYSGNVSAPSTATISMSVPLVDEGSIRGELTGIIDGVSIVGGKVDDAVLAALLANTKLDGQLLDDPYFKSGMAAWTVVKQVADTVTAVTNGPIGYRGNAIAFETSNPAFSSMTVTSKAKVTVAEGETLMFKLNMHQMVQAAYLSCDVQLDYKYANGSSNTVSVGLPDTEMEAWEEATPTTVVPAGALSVEIGIRVIPNTHSGEILYLGGFEAYKLTSSVRIAPDAITVTHIANGAVSETKIAGDAITTPKIKAGAVVAASIAALAVETGNLAANAVTAEKADIASLKAGILTANVIIGTMINGTAIDGKTITGSTIQTTTAVNRGITLNSAGLYAWDGAGVQTFSMLSATGNVVMTKGSLTGMTITGGTIQTLATANRGVKISGTGITSYNSNGEVVLSIPGDGTENSIVGRISTSPLGKPGIILTNITTEGGGGGIWFTSDGGAGGNQAAIYTNANWALILRGRQSASGVDSPVRVQRGMLFEGSGTVQGTGWMISTGGTMLLSKVYTQDFFLQNAPTSTFAANVGIASNPADRFYKVSSARRYKYAIETVMDAERLLNVEPRSWYDSGATDSYADYVEGGDVKLENIPNLKRIPGVVAEEVEDAGLGMYCTYETDGTIQGVSYDRLWTLLIPLVKQLREDNVALSQRLSDLGAAVGYPES